MASHTALWDPIFRILELDAEAALLCPVCKKGDLQITEYRSGQTVLAVEALCVSCDALSQKKYAEDKEGPDDIRRSELLESFSRHLESKQYAEALKTGLALLELNIKIHGAFDFVNAAEVANAAQKVDPAQATAIRNKARAAAETHLMKVLATRNSHVIEFSDALRTAADQHLSDPTWNESDAEELNRKAEAYFRKAAALSKDWEDRIESALRGVITALEFRGETEQARQFNERHFGAGK